MRVKWTSKEQPAHIHIFAGKVGLSEQDKATSGGLGVILKGVELLNQAAGKVIARFVHANRATWTFNRGDWVIYSEQVHGNPLGAQKVARWLLYMPPHDAAATYGKDDLILNYLPCYESFHACICPHAYSATSPYVWTVILPPALPTDLHILPREERTIVAYMVKKGRNWHHPLHETDTHTAIPITAIRLDENDFRETCCMLARAKTVYFLDAFTFFILISAMLGCQPVVLPVPNVSEAVYLGNNALLSRGVTYGIVPDAGKEMELDQVADVVARSVAENMAQTRTMLDTLNL